MQRRRPFRAARTSSAGGLGLRALVALLLVVGGAVDIGATPIRMRYAEAPSHAFLVLTDLVGKTLADGELVQWQERRVLANRLVFRFDDGSLYDETVRFSARPVFRLESYRLVQRGPSFPDGSDVQFERAGHWTSRKHGADDTNEPASGEVAVPDDAYNGMTSTLLKNLDAGTETTVHVLAFTPRPTLVEMRLASEGSDPFWVVGARHTATRFLVTPKVVGVKGVVASVIGKQPAPVRFWLTAGRVPTFVRFEGALYTGGPTWRIELASVRWKR